MSLTRWAPLTGLLLVAAAPAARSPVPAPTGDPAAGAALAAATCAPCHGADGNPLAPAWPRLAGQRPPYLTKQLEDFRSGARADVQMSPVAATLSDAQIRDVAAWFSSQVRAPQRGPGAPPLGAQVWSKGRPADGVAPCVGCHGMRGQGFDGVFPGGVPALAGQQPAYVEKQLRDFAASARGNDLKPVMRAIAPRLTEDEIAAVAAFVGGM